MDPQRRQPQMTRREQVRGLIFFALYFLVFPALKMAVVEFFDRRFGLYLTEAMSAAVYYCIMALLTAAVFRRFLKSGLTALTDFLPENLRAFFIALAGAVLLGILADLLPWPVENPTAPSWAGQYAYSPAATVVIVVILMPMIDEVLFRGLVFGFLRRYSRLAAWAASVLLFMVYNVWTFAVAYGDARYLVLAFQYLPMALALTWCYDRSGSIWTAAVLHAVLDAITLFNAVS